MTVLIYVDTSNRPAIPFANEVLQKHSYKKMTPKAWCSNMRSWSRRRPATCIHVSRTGR
jgi:hypothetical protein